MSILFVPSSFSDEIEKKNHYMVVSGNKKGVVQKYPMIFLGLFIYKRCMRNEF
jgi:hypothetical protein